MDLLFKRIGLFLIVLLLSAALLKWSGVEPNGKKDLLVTRLSRFGALAFFFGPYATGSGGWINANRVNAPSPELAWMVLGIVLWAGAVGCFFGMV